MYTDDAIIGEAAGYAIGLTMLGSKNEQAIEDLVTYSHDTQHEKIIRAIAISLSLIVYGAEESADSLVEQLSREKDPILRYGAMYCIGLAYAGTGNTNALKKLLKFSVSDVNDDVRRAALINIGFLQIRDPEILLENIKVVSLLSESYNPHVRYGAAMALGICCAGTANINAYNILQPLFTDPSFLVRQGSLIATSLIFSQTTQTQEPKLQTFKETLDKVISDKDEHILIRFGGIISQAILELGGRNCIINSVSHSGNNRMGSIVGLVLFTQYYYWFPMIHFLNLAVHPCIMYGIDSNLKVVNNFRVLSKSKPSVFAYPKEVKLQEKIAVQKAPTAVLSTHSRVKAKGKKTATVTSITEMQVEDKKENKKEEEKESEKKEEIPEPNEEILNNPCRIVARQINVVQHIPDQDFVPLLNKRFNGFVLLRKMNPDAVVTYFEEEVKVEPTNVTVSQPQSQPTSNNYQPLPTQDVEMPEEIELSEINKKTK
jgi:26S proteasome regulatory subunit N2